MVILSLCAGIQAYSQSLRGAAKTGVSITCATFRHTLSIEAGYAFSRHWSAEGCAWKDFPANERLSQEEKLHNTLLDKATWAPAGQKGDGVRAEVCYWPSQAFSGLFLSTGCMFEVQKKADGCIGIGYMMHIWKGMAMSMSLKTGISELMAGSDKLTEHIDIGINYIF
ncbi:MAG: hypothetical protein IKU36_08570 [Bacteroidales bacterium]|nr:hypothetical protein [Bacteroidales bacterium]